jgi:hypothetical protein
VSPVDPDTPGYADHLGRERAADGHEGQRVLMTEPHDGHPDTETCPGCPHEVPVRKWLHSRKGPIRGVVVREDDTWTHIRLVGDQRLRYFSVARTLEGHEDGEIITARTSFLTEVPDA